MAGCDLDIAILGGGCAGLSLAVALDEAGLGDRRVAVIEPRTSYPRDRTWCYWDVHGHPFPDADTHRWSRWRVRHRGREVVHASDRYRYCEIPADAFHRAALTRLDACDGVDLRLGERALELREDPGGVRVTTDRGSFRAGCVFDGRPPPPERRSAGLLQHFVGLHVRCDEPVFEPGIATLMDFDVGQERGIHFVYVLPHSHHHALVESTLISQRPLPEPVYTDAIRTYLSSRFEVGDFKIEDRERGIIPMSARPMPSRIARRIYRIGTAGGS